MSYGERDVEINLHRHSDVLVVPVPEPLTDAAFAALRDSILPALQTGCYRGIVFDCTAIDTVDSSTMARWNRLVEASRLLGARTVLASLRPHVAATIVELGSFFEKIEACRSVERAVDAIGTIGNDAAGKTAKTGRTRRETGPRDGTKPEQLVRARVCTHDSDT